MAGPVKMTPSPYTKIDSLGLHALRHYKQYPAQVPQVQILVLNCTSEFVPEGPYALKLMLRHKDNTWSLWQITIPVEGDLNRLKKALHYLESIPSVTSIDDLLIEPLLHQID
jgi:hypothetical protein